MKIGKDISNFSTYSCQPKEKEELQEIINKRMSKEGVNCNLNDIDTSLIDDMSYLFVDSVFNGNISCWNVSNVKNMAGMFSFSCFNGDISKWNVSSVKYMSYIFVNSVFNQDISNWNIDKNCNTTMMFSKCPIKEEYKPKLLRQ